MFSERLKVIVMEILMRVILQINTNTTYAKFQRNVVVVVARVIGVVVASEESRLRRQYHFTESEIGVSIEFRFRQ